MAWTSINNNINYLPIMLYFGAIFWTLGYDTIYGAQDMSDDEIIGIKSTAIKFKNNLKLFIGICYLISSLLISFVITELERNYFLILLLFFMISLFYQIKIFDPKKPGTCLRAFKINNISGLILFLTIFIMAAENL